MFLLKNTSVQLDDLKISFVFEFQWTLNTSYQKIRPIGKKTTQEEGWQLQLKNSFKKKRKKRCKTVQLIKILSKKKKKKKKNTNSNGIRDFTVNTLTIYLIFKKSVFKCLFSSICSNTFK